MNKYNVALYLQRDEINLLRSTFSPVCNFDIEADNYKYAAAAALKEAGITEYSIEDIYCLGYREPGWENDIDIAVRSLNEEDFNEVNYFYLWE